MERDGDGARPSTGTGADDITTRARRGVDHADGIGAVAVPVAGHGEEAGVTITLQAGVGLSVTLLWDGSWKGANFGPRPIGVTAIVAIGIEAGFGVFYNASATQFWNRCPDFPKM